MKHSNKFLVGLILFIWFVISLVTNILGPLMPVIIQTYKLSLTMAAFLPFSFFLAYGVMSVPAGMLIERIGEKKSLLIAFSLNLIGSLVFSLYPYYSVALGSLFIIGMGMAMLQVIINPLMRTAGGEENFAVYSVLAQLVFGFASFVSPYIFSYLYSGLLAHVQGDWLIGTLSSLVRQGLSWTAMYWLFTTVFIRVISLIAFIKILNVELKDDEKAGAFTVYIELLKQRPVWLFFLGIVAYVGTEQSLANWMSEFLRTYHGVDPNKGGAHAVAWFWGLMSVGCLLGIFLLKLWDARLVLKWAVATAAITVSLSLFGSVQIALYTFPLAGFFISVMFSIVFSLALNSIAMHHGSFSGILCSGIFGGALIPLIVGSMADMFGLRIAMTFLYVTLGYILFLAFYAKPLVDNKTVSFKELLKL
ncbi:fucose permease [Mucilaginibacter yixingensis]|uniref:Fucose permease n=1 Tax=Mucilaginibacter yixingensis TaxID=1295612 RepID=A0A2T5J685_9SPHI|nr:MFS transporter [Mucilaginibacter yixingensis]PTQ93981.1 fucose permease [Mucilaginibacter yixingensis]